MKWHEHLDVCLSKCNSPLHRFYELLEHFKESMGKVTFFDGLGYSTLENAVYILTVFISGMRNGKASVFEIDFNASVQQFPSLFLC